MSYLKSLDVRLGGLSISEIRQTNIAALEPL